jgi:beta-lactamase regulating signal transducer with metallopeptidase domain
MTLTLLVVAWLLTYLVHSTILLGGAWLLSAARIVRSPVATDVLWKVCLVGGILTATVYSAFPYQPYSAHVLLPGVSRAALAAGAQRLDLPVAAASAGALSPAWASPVSAVIRSARRTAAPLVQPMAAATPIANPQAAAPSLWSWPYVILGVWLLGAVLFLVRVQRCRRRFARQLRDRREITGGPLVAMLDSLRATAGARRPIRLTTSSELAGPVAMGAAEICIPERALTALSPAQQRAVLAHELGHLVRQDPIWLGLSVACESLLFFQPLNVLARRRVQEAAEFLCDDWAVHQTGGSLTLARCLAEVATWIETAPRAVMVSGMASNRSQLLERVHRLLEGAQPSVRRMRSAVPLAALALSTVAFAAPGISPPCDQDEGVPAAQASSSWARAARQGGPHAWATIRDAHLITFRDGFAPRLTGQGHLGIRRGGRAIELGDGQRLLLNGREPRDDREIEVCETDSVQIVDAEGRTLWQLEPVRVAPERATGWAEAGSAPESWSTAESQGLGEARARLETRARDERRVRDGVRVRDETRVRGVGRLDSLDDELDSLGSRFDALDTVDVEAVARAAVLLGERVTHAVDVHVVPELVRAQDAAVLVSAGLAPRLAEIGTRVATEVVPALVRGLCDGGLCDDGGAPPRKSRKVLSKHRP